ncbi:hypothetical protein H8B06_18535 [Sphingobacterium sp. DN00404]|uniref:Uncharacterized protein n=1 Tax=Sphingobacterium micropteri TaxID=2763501 RepID=A0ABR7YU11_9SPHI|nr:hypothetical protein [Sphingobacterium micropteri]MBD1434828.1 hypothetical protein [Sphingobacterium micropteri]
MQTFATICKRISRYCLHFEKLPRYGEGLHRPYDKCICPVDLPYISFEGAPFQPEGHYRNVEVPQRRVEEHHDEHAEQLYLFVV